ncbi:MAG: BREX system P-loop protein BrxC [Bacteroidales bacterium]
MLIKDILTIDLSEDIKNVIDLEDVSEAAIQSEIENYIITDGLAKEYSDFVSTFTSNILETGVWISGFYGSGKSYFGKLLGYMMSNRKINGSPARDRIMQRFTGIEDEALVKNSINKLDSQKCRVIFLDIAKQDTSKGLAYALYRNFLKSLDLPDNEHGIFLYDLMINEKQGNISDFIYQHLEKDWNDIRPRRIEYAKAAKSIFLAQGNTESDYENIMTTIRRDIDQFSASRFRDELMNYTKIVYDEKLIFIFDEASEAINRNKFTLLDLEGLSEALSDSDLSRKTWTIAIAQEKLDDVINNSNVSRVQLTKVTDRFKTKIHLEATEVDVIIRNRLLSKTEDGIKKLTENYNKNSGKIADHASLYGTGISKTETLESYLTYYPLYKYQFDLLQNFLFGTKGYASTKVAARGMIITSYDILRHEIQHGKLFEVATGWQIAKEAQPQPPVRLVSRYDNADRILKIMGSTISGRKLLETIHFLSEAEVVPTTLPNILKSYIRDQEEYHKIQPEIVKALEDLVESKVLLVTNNTYRITSDIEQRLLDEMNGFTVQTFNKKKKVVTAYKSSVFIKTLARITESSLQYDFFISTDNEDELTSPTMKFLKIKLKSLYNISDDRTTEIDALRVQTQNDKDVVWIIPDNGAFKEIDKLIEEIEKIGYLEDKYKNPLSDEGQILRSFSTSRDEKENTLRDLIEQSLQRAAAIYLYNLYQLDANNWQTTIQEQQRQVVKNVYHKRLASQLSDSIAAVVIKETSSTRLHQFYNGNDFQFFDKNGNFIGDNLKVVEEIIYKIRNTFVEGSVLEKELESPPTGFVFGTVMSTVAALMRAGKVMAKYNGDPKFSWQDNGVSAIFATAREFRRSSFKAIARSLSAVQKNELVTSLKDLSVEDRIKFRVDWNTNDYELVGGVKELAKYLCDKVDFMRKQNKDFDALFVDAEKQKEFLSGFTGSLTEANYIDRAEEYLKEKEAYTIAVQSIDRVEKFIRTNLPKLIEWKEFVHGVKDELKKAAIIDTVIDQLAVEFEGHFKENVVKNFSLIQQVVQKIKDEYFNLMNDAASKMAASYSKLKQDAESVLHEIAALPDGLNAKTEYEINSICQYATQRTSSEIDLGYDVKDKQTRFTYSEMLSFIELYNGKKTNLEILRTGLIKLAPSKPDPDPSPESGKATQIVTLKTIKTTLPAKKLKVLAYKQWLTQELQKLSDAGDNDEIEFNA